MWIYVYRHVGEFFRATKKAGCKGSQPAAVLDGWDRQ